ncbi:MAG: heterocyst frequency control protein PatD [Leptolyngbyaceae bacterium]|nr:heterocyst frequency control protein PatD [Leptolyngbyaceae bacterium]
MEDERFEVYATMLQMLSQMVTDLESQQLQSLKEQHKDVQRIFQEKALVVDADSQTVLNSSQLQSIQTEMNRDLRVMHTELMFLSAARHQGTVDQRQQQIGDRLNRLIEFCTFVLNQASPPSSEG